MRLAAGPARTVATRTLVLTPAKTLVANKKKLKTKPKRIKAVFFILSIAYRLAR